MYSLITISLFLESVNYTRSRRHRPATYSAIFRIISRTRLFSIGVCVVLYMSLINGKIYGRYPRLKESTAMNQRTVSRSRRSRPAVVDPLKGPADITRDRLDVGRSVSFLFQARFPIASSNWLVL